MFTVAPGSRIVGMQLPIQAQSTFFVAEWERTAGPGELAQVAQACDAAGFAYVGVCDHVALPAAVSGSMGFHWVDPVSTLGWLAALTTRVHLLTHIYVLPYRHHLMAAKQFATLDHLSGGRMICGVGAGHVEAEFDHLGVDFANRGRAMDTGVPALIDALTHEVVDGFGATPRPVQQPRPPVWLAGSSAAAVRRAARLADGWLPQGPATPDAVEVLVGERERCGRGDEPLVVGTITPFLYVGTPKWDIPDDTLVAGPAELAERLVADNPSAVNQFQVRFRARSATELCDQIAAFGEGVLGPLGAAGGQG
jgi:probable F420-dependent oxidoreductase